MVETTWYYARGGERVGPLTAEQMRALAADGQLRRDDSVWADGMPQWESADTRPELFGATAVSSAGGPRADPAGGGGGAAPQAVAAHPSTVGYYVSTSGMPARAAQHLKGHATPTGDTGDWPLDDARVAAFRETMKLRKKVFAAAQLYRALFALAVIAGMVLVVVTVGMVVTTGRNAGRGTATVVMGTTLAILLAVTLLYFFAWRGTARSQRWAPVTMLALFLIGVAANLLSIAIAMSGRGGPTAMLGGVIGIVFPLLFAVVSWNAVSAIPKFLAQPAWCQELIAASEL